MSEAAFRPSEPEVPAPAPVVDAPAPAPLPAAPAFSPWAQARGLVLRELQAVFLAPMTYLVWAVFLVAGGYLFATSLQDGGVASLSDTFTRLAVLMVFVVPLLTMRLVAEELRTGTMDVLLSDPVSEAAVILSKYVATVAFIVVMLLPTLAYPIVLGAIGSPDPGPIVAGYLGLLLVGATFAAVGLAASAVTGHPIAAGAVSFTLLLMSWMLSRASQAMSPGLGRDLVAYSSVFSHYAPFRQGMCDTRSVVFCVTVSAFVLFVAVQALALRRLR